MFAFTCTCTRVRHRILLFSVEKLKPYAHKLQSDATNSMSTQHNVIDNFTLDWWRIYCGTVFDAACCRRSIFIAKLSDDFFVNSLKLFVSHWVQSTTMVVGVLRNGNPSKINVLLLEKYRENAHLDPQYFESCHAKQIYLF